MEEDLKNAFVTAWNEIAAEREERLPAWEEKAAVGNALERYRARLMIAVTAEDPLEVEVPEMTRMFLEEIIVHSPEDYTVHMLDGTIKRVSICPSRN